MNCLRILAAILSILGIAAAVLIINGIIKGIIDAH